MATSGSIDLSMTAQALVTFALKKAGIIDVLHSPAAEEMRDGIELLNLMLKGWQIDGPNLWRQTQGSATLVAATSSYTLSPRALRVSGVRYRDTSGRDMPMIELAHEEYYELPDKSAQGVPTSYYVDYQRATTVIYVWPVLAAATTESLRYTYQRTIEDVDDQANDLDIPQEWFETIGYNLADRIAESHGQPNDRITARAQRLLMMAKDYDRAPVVRFVPGWSG